MIRGIGPVYAKKRVRAFGEKVFDIIKAEPDRRREVTGIGPMRANRITGAWTEQKIVAAGHDREPYRLARDIRSIGFKTADAIAMELGVEKTAAIRVRAGISYALREAMDEGRCGLPVEELKPLASCSRSPGRKLVQTALDLELVEMVCLEPDRPCQPQRCRVISAVGKGVPVP